VKQILIVDVPEGYQVGEFIGCYSLGTKMPPMTVEPVTVLDPAELREQVVLASCPWCDADRCGNRCMARRKQQADAIMRLLGVGK